MGADLSSNARFPWELQDSSHNSKYAFHTLLPGGLAFANSYHIYSGQFVRNQGLSIEQLPEIWALEKPDSQRFPFVITGRMKPNRFNYDH